MLGFETVETTDANRVGRADHPSSGPPPHLTLVVTVALNSAFSVFFITLDFVGDLWTDSRKAVFRSAADRFVGTQRFLSAHLVKGGVSWGVRNLG